MTGKAIATPAAPTFLNTPEATVQELSWWMPFFLFLGGWITYLFRSSNTGFEIGAVIGALVVCRSVYLLVFKCQDVRFTWVTSCGLLLGYALGTFNTAAQLAKKHQTVAEHFFRLQDDLSFALSLVLWASAVLFLAGGVVEKPIQLNFAKLLKFDGTYLALAFLLYILALATHQIGYMGSSVSEEGHVTILATIAGMTGPTLPALTVVFRRKSKLLSRAVLFWGLLISEMAMLVPSGRRALIYSLLLVVFAFTLSGDRWKSALWKKALIIGICVAGLYGGNVMFYAMRHEAEVGRAAGRIGAPNIKLGELVSNAIRFLREGRDASFDEEVATNLQDRTFVLRYFSDLVTQSWTHTPVHGRVALFSVSMATPSAIYGLFGNKDKVIALGMEETVANPDFGLVATDEANSLLTGGLCDWGIPGLFIYPLGVALLINFVIRVGLGRAPELMRLIAVMLMVETLFQTELAVTGIVVLLRNLALLLLFWIPIYAAARFFLKSPNRVPRERPGRRAVPEVILVRYEAIPRSR